MAGLTDKVRRIRLVVFDVDGVFTDGRLYYSDRDEELKSFHTRDGYGVKRLLESGIQVAIISGRESKAVARRMDELGVKHVFQGCKDKVPVLEELMQTTGVGPAAVAFVGDDMPDAEPMARVGLGVAVADAHPKLRKRAVYKTRLPGGHGAVREVCDLILDAQDGSRDAT